MNSLVMLSILLKLIFSDKTNLIYYIIKKILFILNTIHIINIFYI